MLLGLMIFACVCFLAYAWACKRAMHVHRELMVFAAYHLIREFVTSDRKWSDDDEHTYVRLWLNAKKYGYPARAGIKDPRSVYETKLKPCTDDVLH
jgi:hypothetical protein